MSPSKVRLATTLKSTDGRKWLNADENDENGRRLSLPTVSGGNQRTPISIYDEVKDEAPVLNTPNHAG